jgi:hypothetical protein
MFDCLVPKFSETQWLSGKNWKSTVRGNFLVCACYCFFYTILNITAEFCDIFIIFTKAEHQHDKQHFFHSKPNFVVNFVFFCKAPGGYIYKALSIIKSFSTFYQQGHFAVHIAVKEKKQFSTIRKALDLKRHCDIFSCSCSLTSIPGLQSVLRLFSFILGVLPPGESYFQQFFTSWSQ